jgi:cyanophycin synthetase
MGGALQSARRRLGETVAAPTAADLNVENVQAAAERLGVDVELLPGGFLKLTHGSAVSYARSADFAFERLIPYFVCGDKWLTSTLLSDEGLPVPRFGVFDVSSYDEALRFFGELARPVVTKPARGTAGGAGITLAIATRAAFRAGFARARAAGRDVLVEEQVEGENVRVTILDGQVLGAVRRIPAHVLGDGERSVTALVEDKNERWRTQSPDNRLLRPIAIDADARRILGAQGLDPGSVPDAGRVVRLREVSNADQGGEIADVRGEIHPEHLDLATRAASVVGPILCGVDLIVRDLGEPAQPGNVYINEVNTTPSLYVANEMVAGAPSTTAAEAVLRRLFDLPA